MPTTIDSSTIQISLNSQVSASQIASPKIFVVEAIAGESRREFLERLLADNNRHGATFSAIIDGDRYRFGPWAGLNQLLAGVLPEIERQRPDLASQCDYEIVRVLPHLKKVIKVRHSNFIDVLPPNEPKLTYYPVERVFRIVYGMVDLFQSWQAYREYDRLIVVCDNYDRSSSLVRGFFTELLRRVGKRVNLTLVLAANPGNGNKVLEEFDSYTDKQFIKLDLPTTEIFPSAAEMSRLAEDLATQIGNDKIEREIHLPQLIQYWQNSDRPELAVDAQIKALRVYLKQCYYEDALYYGECALAGLQQYYPADLDRYWDVCEKLHDCYICLNRSDDALNIIQKAIATTTNPERLFKGFNRMATIDARYLRDRRNLAKSEEYINLGFQQLENIDRPPVEKFYYKALLMRGLALIRHLQGRFDEALEICRSTYDETIRIAGSNRYLAHQTLLQFNISRVYISTKQPEAALVAISQAIEIDPEYSEYYNHRGNIYAGIKHFDEAVADYIKAIETSPPYPEVWTNLAQCYRQMDELDRAIAAYTRSLELSPAVSLALIGRAQCYELLGEISLAIADYSHALELDSNQPLVLANRATLYYEIADYNSSLEDLNTALKLAPDNAEFHQNRAIAFLSLGRTTEAILDLQTYLNINPEAADKMEVETQISELQNPDGN